MSTPTKLNTKERDSAMKDSNDHYKPPAKKYTKAVMPRGDAEEESDAMKEARAKSREALMLDVILKDGTVESFDYATPKRATLRPDGTLLLQFGEDGIKIEGRNLERVRLLVTECRLRSISEGTQAEADIHPDDATHIASISVVRAGLEW